MRVLSRALCEYFDCALLCYVHESKYIQHTQILASIISVKMWLPQVASLSWKHCTCYQNSICSCKWDMAWLSVVSVHGDMELFNNAESSLTCLCSGDLNRQWQLSSFCKSLEAAFSSCFRFSSSFQITIVDHFCCKKRLQQRIYCTITNWSQLVNLLCSPLIFYWICFFFLLPANFPSPLADGFSQGLIIGMNMNLWKCMYM